MQLTWHLAMQNVALEQLRADRVLHEALAVDADPLHLAKAFGVSTQTAIDYSEIARTLLARPVEDQPPTLNKQPHPTPPTPSMPRVREPDSYEPTAF
ncbi:MAG TPA: hypothetical protein VFV67_18930 [Actinophytocola sp.]|uniref:hypothetical protein n=1 Tax=Actinophytocola sp. TaxID=1872138 RepID=UPI002DBE56BE|nr:hypothetical protein [Actinophytocola sp.]HEU5472727.1 hypothetical protein [Actinophytocola sp.]